MSSSASNDATLLLGSVALIYWDSVGATGLLVLVLVPVSELVEDSVGAIQPLASSEFSLRKITQWPAGGACLRHCANVSTI